jgi:hypothetical protein
VIEFQLKGPKIKAPQDSICFWMTVPYGKTVQKWAGYYLGDGDYAIRYIPKQAEVLNYRFTSAIPEIDGQSGQIVVHNSWPGKRNTTDYNLGPNWFTDKKDEDLYYGKIQGGQTIFRWRGEILSDWAKRWSWVNAE